MRKSTEYWTPDNDFLINLDIDNPRDNIGSRFQYQNKLKSDNDLQLYNNLEDKNEFRIIRKKRRS